MKFLSNDARIGIINRGEAACRFIRAACEFNLLNDTQVKTVAFYTDKEKDALFVQEADFAYALSSFSRFADVKGPVYLDHELLIQALVETGCQGVWVGWGFVSEDAEFVRKVEEAGLVFLGPGSTVMHLVGDKISSKELAEKSGTPICPWSGGPVPNLDEAYKVAEKIGYPCVVKASNAGGGRGIRFVFNKDEMAAQYQSAVEETLRITGNTLVFMERLVEVGRHLEVQALADAHGCIKTFGVRDCSVQRKNQKIIEETPPAHLSKDVLQKIQDAARGLLKEAKYCGAGTVEFLYDVKRNEFYFMEVNARLQVEHPITEQLYGIDLAAAQIAVGFGHSIEEMNTMPHGHVAEVRLNAEDTEHGFRPAGGFVRHFKSPGGPGVRVDSGIQNGSFIPPDFDSMVAKIIVTANNRRQAFSRLYRAVQETQVDIAGGTTNRTFLLELLRMKEILEGGVSTRFVEQYLENRQNVGNYAAEALLVAAAETYLQREEESRSSFYQQMIFNGYSRSLPAVFTQEINLKYAGAAYSLLVRRINLHIFGVQVAGKKFYFEYSRGIRNTLTFNGNVHHLTIGSLGQSMRVEIDHIPYLLEGDTGGMIKAPSPGLVLQVKVSEGQRVNKGDVLLTLEAMKMELPVTAGDDGVVTEIFIKSGEQLSAGQPLMRFEKSEENEKKDEADAQAEDVFARLSSHPLKLEEEFLALVMGFDALSFDTLKDLYFQQKSAKPLLVMLEAYADYLTIFSNDRLPMKGYTSKLTYKQHLVNYYSSYERQEKDFPAAFLEALQRVFGRFSCELGCGYLQNEILYHCYRFSTHMPQVAAFVEQMLPSLEEFPDSNDEKLPQILDKIAYFMPSLKYVCARVRYRLVDYPLRESLAADRLNKQAKNIELLVKYEQDQDKMMHRLVNYGKQSEPYLLRRILNHDRPETCLKILAHRMYRDCVISDWQENIPGKMVSFIYLDHAQQSKRSHVAATQTLQEGLSLLADVQGDVALLYTPQAVSLEILNQSNLKLSRICVGQLTESDMIYSNFLYENGTWQIDGDRQNMSPLFYREMRIYRLSEFTKEYNEIVPGLVVAYAQHRRMPQDRRFFLFISLEVIEVQTDEDKEIVKIVGFEDRLLRGIVALQDAQAQFNRPLPWNRIVVFIRPRMSAQWNQIEAYSRKMVMKYMTNTLGLERISVYLRDEHNQYHELVISQFVPGSVHCENRIAKTTPLEALNEYTSKVSISQSRDLFYPYQLIQALESGSFGQPAGKFSEYDLKSEDSLDYVSVAGRPVSQNKANLIFGILETPLHGDICRRVAIFSDASSDMGSLAEAECRRVNAALQLAQDEKIPAEWVATSSGARINMTSGTENLDWTAKTLRKIIEYTQAGGELNIIVMGTNVGAQSYWNSEATMLMHCRGLLIMTKDASMILTGKKALDFSGSVSGENNLAIGGCETIMLPNGEAQILAEDLEHAYSILWHYYDLSYSRVGQKVKTQPTADSISRDVGKTAYMDELGQGFKNVGDIFSKEYNPERKKSFDMRQVMRAVIDEDCQPLERWKFMQHAETAIVWHARIGGEACGVIGIESRPLIRHGFVSFDGPTNYAGGTLYPQSSKKVARAVNSFSGKVPLIVLANLSGFDGSPESLRRNQLEWGAEIGRAIVNFQGSILFVVVSRYHGGAYVVFSKALNENLRSIALEGSFASVIGGAPAAAVVFPGQVRKSVYEDKRIVKAQKNLKTKTLSLAEFEELYKQVYNEKQSELAQHFDQVHSVQRAKDVGSIDEIINISQLRKSIVSFIQKK